MYVCMYVHAKLTANSMLRDFYEGKPFEGEEWVTKQPMSAKFIRLVSYCTFLTCTRIYVVSSHHHYTQSMS